MRPRAVLAALACLLAGAAGGCGSSAPSGVATNPGSTAGLGSPAAGGSTGPAAQSSGTRTVLAALGLNVRNGPAHTAKIVGSASRGTELTVTGHVDDDGGWYQVRGQTTTGWITADPDLSAEGSLTDVAITEKLFDALYAPDWTYANGPGETVFRPQKGSQSIVVRPLPSVAALGSPGLPGYTRGAIDTVVACGYTGQSVQYAASTAPTATVSPVPTADGGGGQVIRLANFAQLLLQLDATHVLDVEYNYATRDQLVTFRNFYNGITFPFPQCQQVAAPAPAPT